MSTESDYMTFVAADEHPIGLQVRVNFGLCTGREATPAELDELARRLLDEVDYMSIIAERRYEVSASVEATVHQIRIEVEPSALPDGAEERERLAERIAAAADEWASACVADRTAFATGM